MATKINIDNIVKAIRNTKSTKIKLDLVFCYEKGKSDAKIDNKFAMLTEHFLPLWLLISVEYYFLENENNKIPVERLDHIRKFREVLLNLWCDENEIKYIMNPNGIVESDDEAYIRIEKLPKMAKTLFERFSMNCSRLEFFNKINVIADDTSKEHIHAFNVSSKSAIPKENILIKLTDGSIHLRIGMKIFKNDRTVRIIRIAEKNQLNRIVIK